VTEKHLNGADLEAGGLNAAHRKIAAGWHTDIKGLKSRGYRLLSAKETFRAVRCNTPSVEIPYLDLEGKQVASRFRLADPSRSPDGKRKYSTARGSPVALFLPRGVNWKQLARSPKEPVYITEGEAKAQFLVDHFGIAAIGTQGCWAWQAQGKPAQQFDLIEWEGRRAYLIPDSDFRRNPDVRRGFAQLGKLLRDKLKARVRMVLVPDLPEHFNRQPGGRYKTGIDDWGAATRAEREDFIELRKQVSLPLDHPEIQSWDGNPVTALPEALRDLRPVGTAWIEEPPPKIEYVVAPYWQLGETATVVGTASVGKTYFLMRMLIALATGTPFFGFPVQQKRRAMYLLAERGGNSARRRFYKIVQDTADGIRNPREREQFLADVAKNCIVRVVSGETFHLVEQIAGQWQVAPAVDALIAELRAAGVEALFLDPLSRLHGGDEDNAVFSAITKAAERIVQSCVSVMVAHHTGKNVRGDMYSGRGGSAFNDNTSETIVLMSVGQDEQAGLNLTALKPEDRGCDLIRVRHARCSDGAPARDTYLVRSRDTGLLRHVKVDAKTADDVLFGHLEDIRKWASAHEDSRFSKFQFCRDKKSFANVFGISKAKARDLLDEAERAGVVRATESKRRGGGTLYELNVETKTSKTSGVLRTTSTTSGRLEKRAVRK